MRERHHEDRGAHQCKMRQPRLQDHICKGRSRKLAVVCMCVRLYLFHLCFLVSRLSVSVGSAIPGLLLCFYLTCL